MELTYSQLKKRDVVNINDGKSFGKMVDINISFPSGKVVGIIVPGNKKSCPIRLFSKNEIYIPESKIIKIGNDVILVDIKCGESCAPNIDLNYKPKEKPCPNPCKDPFCPCPPKPPKGCSPYEKRPPTCEEVFGDNSYRIDSEEY